MLPTLYPEVRPQPWHAGDNTPHSQPHSTPNAHPSPSPSATGWVRVSKDTSTIKSKNKQQQRKMPPRTALRQAAKQPPRAPPRAPAPHIPPFTRTRLPFTPALPRPTATPKPQHTLSKPPFHSTHGTTSSPRRGSLAPPPPTPTLPPHGHPQPCRKRCPSPPC